MACKPRRSGGGRARVQSRWAATPLPDKNKFGGQDTRELALLALRPMHGYEMTAFIEEEGLSDVCPVEQSTLYTYLRNVESRGLVAWTEERVGQRPPRKIFELTPVGRELIDGWLRRPVGRMREVRLDLLIKLFFLARLDPGANRRLLADHTHWEELRRAARTRVEEAFGLDQFWRR